MSILLPVAAPGEAPKTGAPWALPITPPARPTPPAGEPVKVGGAPNTGEVPNPLAGVPRGEPREAGEARGGLPGDPSI